MWIQKFECGYIDEIFDILRKSISCVQVYCMGFSILIVILFPWIRIHCVKYSNVTFSCNFFPASAQVYSILRHVAEVLEYTKDEQLESLFQRTAWVFDDKYKKPGYGAYDAFKLAVS